MQVVKEAKADDKDGLSAAQKKWSANGKEILSKANQNWPRREEEMLQRHLDMTPGEVVRPSQQGFGRRYQILRHKSRAHADVLRDAHRGHRKTVSDKVGALVDVLQVEDDCREMG